MNFSLLSMKQCKSHKVLKTLACQQSQGRSLVFRPVRGFCNFVVLKPSAVLGFLRKRKTVRGLCNLDPPKSMASIGLRHTRETGAGYRNRDAKSTALTRLRYERETVTRFCIPGRRRLLGGCLGLPSRFLAVSLCPPQKSQDHFKKAMGGCLVGFAIG